MDSEIVYLEINDWTPTRLQKKFIDDLLARMNPKIEKICIHCEVWDQSMNYWITCERDWLERNYPELLDETVEKETEHLDWKPENYGYHLIAE